MSDWTDTIKYFNGLSDEKQEIFLIEVKHMINGNNNTIALYVNYLHKAGFLDRTGRGLYRRIQNIPSNLTLSQLKRFTYPEGISQKDRKRIIDRYWKLQNIKNKTV